MHSCVFSAIPYHKMHPHVQNGLGAAFGTKKIVLRVTKHEQQQAAAAARTR